MDPDEKQEKTKIMVKPPGETNSQIFPFQAGTNEAYITHAITTKQLLEKKEMQENVEKAFGAVTAIRDDKLGPLYKKLNMSKVNSEKKDLKKQIETLIGRSVKGKEKGPRQDCQGLRADLHLLHWQISDSVGQG